MSAPSVSSRVNRHGMALLPNDLRLSGRPHEISGHDEMSAGRAAPTAG
jgi:hypothetical protein